MEAAAVAAIVFGLGFLAWAMFGGKVSVGGIGAHPTGASPGHRVIAASVGLVAITLGAGLLVRDGSSGDHEDKAAPRQSATTGGAPTTSHTPTPATPTPATSPPSSAPPTTEANGGTSSADSGKGTSEGTSIQFEDAGSYVKTGPWAFSTGGKLRGATLKVDFTVLGKDGQQLDDGCYLMTYVTSAGKLTPDGKVAHGCAPGGWVSWNLPVGRYQLVAEVNTDWGETAEAHQDFTVAP